MKKIARPVLWTVFIIYCFILVYVLFLSRGTRVGFTYAEYMRRFTNFIPFKTIIEYVKDMRTVIGIFLLSICWGILRCLSRWEWRCLAYLRN